MEKGDFEIKVEKELLSINGKRETPTREGETFRRKEFGNYTFKRHFQLSDTVDANTIEANYVNGILNIFVPKREEAKEQPPRKIEVA
jgi:HSP20 family protein